MRKLQYLTKSPKLTFDGIHAWAMNLVRDLNTALGNISVPVGGIVGYGAATAPTGWLLADGTTVTKQNYPELFTVIGYTYGGAGDNFDLPTVANSIVKA